MRGLTRRAALLAASGCLTAFPGCLGGSAAPASGTPDHTPTETPARCDAADRPAPPGPGADPPGDPDGYEYPEPPASLSAGPVRAYARAHERAYRRNDLYAEWGRHLLDASVRVEAATTHDAPAGAAIAQVAYRYDATVEGDDGPIEIDSPRVYAAYAIDDAVIRRAVDTAHRTATSELVVDPTVDGSPVACR